MILTVVVAALAILALITQAGVFALQRVYPAHGRMIEVAGGALHVVEHRAARCRRPADRDDPRRQFQSRNACGNRSATGLPKIIG